MTKDSIRQLMRQRKAECPQWQRTQLSCAAVERVEASGQWQHAQTVLLYHSLPDEVDTHDLVRRAVRDGKRVLLPAVVGEELELRSFRSDDDLQQGAFHILQPSGATFTDTDAIDFALIPGVAFTPDGCRLGRGRGYYDRLLPRLRNAYKVGICWPFQLLPQLPCLPHDVRMDAVVCPHNQ
mgnify:CR=1 FL=1